MLFRLLLLCLLPIPLAAHEVPWVHYAVIDGAEVLESASPEIDETTLFAIASVGKTMTALATLRLVERGALGLDDRAVDLRPDLPPLAGIDGVTLRQLLTMRSGLAEYYWDDYARDALRDRDAVQRPLVALGYALEEEALFPPGTAHEYINTNYVILGLILEAVTGQSYAEVIRDEVFVPAGMTDCVVFGDAPLPDTFVRGHERRLGHVRDYYAGEGFGDGGVLCSARDLVRFYDALFKTARLLSPAMLGEMVTLPRGQSYGMGIVVSGDLVGHSGADLGFVSDVVMDRQSGNIGVALVGSSRADTDWAYDIVVGD